MKQTVATKKAKTGDTVAWAVVDTRNNAIVRDTMSRTAARSDASVNTNYRIARVVLAR